MDELLGNFAVGSWRVHYLDYQSLNKQIEAISVALENGRDPADLEVSFFNELDKQLNKLNKFSSVAQNFFKSRIALLETRLEEFSRNPQKVRSKSSNNRISSSSAASPLERKTFSLSSQQQQQQNDHPHESKTQSQQPQSQQQQQQLIQQRSTLESPLSVDIPNVNADLSSSSTLIEETASSPPFTPQTTEQNSELQPNLLQFDILVCGRGLLNLEDYASINYTGFEQILDGFEAITSKPTDFYMERVEKAEFYENAPYEDLCTKLEVMNQKLAVLLNKKHKKPTPPSEQSSNRPGPGQDRHLTSSARAYCVEAKGSGQSEFLPLVDNVSPAEDPRTPDSDLAATHFMKTFVAPSDDEIPTQKRKNLEFWRQCRRLNGIQFQIPVPREAPQASVQKASFNQSMFRFAMMIILAISAVYIIHAMLK